jgi:SulP family sulfate permease
MVSLATLRSVIGSTRADTVVFFITALITVSFDLIEAVAIGIAVASFFALRALVRSSGVHREEIPGPVQDGDEHIAVFRLDGALFFAAAERVLERVSTIRNVDVVIIRMSQLQVLDATGARVITDIVNALERRGITVLIKGIQDRHLALVTRVGVLESLRHHKHLFAELPPAVEHARSHVARARAARAAQNPTHDAGDDTPGPPAQEPGTAQTPTGAAQ